MNQPTSVKDLIQLPLGKGFAIKKSYRRPDGSLGIEGFISTDKKDIEKDILQPEAFMGPALPEYMERGAPVSREHQTKVLPIGYLLKSRLVRDGYTLQENDNPHHPSEDFRYFAGGTGWYGLGVVYDSDAIKGIEEHTVSSFSWIGMPVSWESTEDGGRHFVQKGSVNPLLEVTVTAYPVNPTATFAIAKSRGYVTQLYKDKFIKLLEDPELSSFIVDLLVPKGVGARAVEAELKRHRDAEWR